MSGSLAIAKYQNKYAVSSSRPFYASSVDGIRQAVVIPALAESRSLFKTLASIAENPQNELQRAMILCVINNQRPPLATAEQINDNEITLRILKGLVGIRKPSFDCPDDMRPDIEKITRSGMRISCIDASSRGAEMPDRGGGVGTARKIGMDSALMFFGPSAIDNAVISCLDADTIVEDNYLSEVRGHLDGTNDPAAVTKYAHQKPDDPELLSAISGYEIFLRSYVLGLIWAKSPYAYHAIGSTMSCTAKAYVAVRGMNRRQAAEDFHFLNKVAKIGKIGVVEKTTVFPSSRPSNRVPFGTGQRMLQFISGSMNEWSMYDPRIFGILRKWLAAIEGDPNRSAETIIDSARSIHPALKDFLDLNQFQKSWVNIKRNCRDSDHLRRQFHVWFDALKTLRLVHHLSRSGFSTVPVIPGLKDLLGQMNRTIPSFCGDLQDTAGKKNLYGIVTELRHNFPES